MNEEKNKNRKIQIVIKEKLIIELDEQAELLIKTVERWKKMIEWAKKQDLQNYPQKEMMKKIIGICWDDFNDNPLCKKYRRPLSSFLKKDIDCQSYHDHIVICKDSCPIYRAIGICDSDENIIWTNIINSKTWKEWIENAQKFVDILIRILGCYILFIEIACKKNKLTNFVSNEYEKYGSKLLGIDDSIETFLFLFCNRPFDVYKLRSSTGTN